jgi:predicted PurR-regulated permease PerM
MPAAPENSENLFTDTQRRIVSSALTLFALLGSVALLVGAIVAFGRLIGYFSGVLWPIATAGVLALILHPVVEAVEKHCRLRRTAAVVLLYGIFMLFVAGVLLLLLPPLIDQLLDFVLYVPELWASAFEYIQRNYPNWVALMQQQLGNPIVKKVVGALTAEARELVMQVIPSLRNAGGGVVQMIVFITHAAIVPVYLFFFLLIRGDPTRNMKKELPFLKPGIRNDVMFLFGEFVAILESFFRGQLLIGSIMGVLLALGFTIVGLKFGLVIGLAVGLLNIVPYLGTIVGLSITLPLAFFQPGGGWKLVFLVLLVKVLVQAVESWVLTPKIMGNRTGLHPVMIILAVFFWGTAFGGILGMLLAIPLTAFFVIVWRLAKRKYFQIEKT